MKTLETQEPPEEMKAIETQNFRPKVGLVPLGNRLLAETISKEVIQQLQTHPLGNHFSTDFG